MYFHKYVREIFFYQSTFYRLIYIKMQIAEVHCKAKTFGAKEQERS